jgi:hypothetical protein
MKISRKLRNLKDAATSPNITSGTGGLKSLDLGFSRLVMPHFSLTLMMFIFTIIFHSILKTQKQYCIGGISKMEKVLVNSDKYNGQYVAMKSIDDNTIVGSGETPSKALEEARKKGIQNPFLLYVPDKDVINIYYAY